MILADASPEGVVDHRWNVAIAFGISMLAGCATGGVRQVTLTAGKVADGARPLDSMSVYVVPNTKMTDTVLEARVRAQVEKALLAKGYKFGPPESADAYVLASFGALDVNGQVDVEAFYPPMTKTTRTANGGVVRRTYAEHLGHEKVDGTIKSVAVILSAADAKLFRETGTVRVIWMGQASTPAQPDLLNRMVPYLLVSALKYFGTETHGEQSIEIRDKEIKSWPPVN